jgi:hypothetical protein
MSWCSVGSNDDNDAYRAELQEVRDYEIEMAIASWHCTEGIQGGNAGDIYGQVGTDYRRELAEGHPELLEPFQ